MSSPRIQSILNDRFGLDALRPLQQEIIERVLDGGDALVVMPTGSGKSLCFQLPALVKNQESGGVGLVFSPLIALMEDQVHALQKRGINAAFVNSTVPPQERRKRYQKLANGEYELFYATPERMTKPDFREALDQVPGGVNLLAIDECHCVTKWGHDLRPAYQRIGEFRKELGNPMTIALTATATRAVREDVRTVIGATLESMPLFAAPVDRPNLKLRCVEAWDDDDKIEKLRSTLKGIEGTSIVYFTLIKDLERMAPNIMRQMDRPVEIYHGRLPPNERRRVYNQFINATPRENLLLCATNAFGMGVDKSDLRSVIHAQLPGSVEAYHQEVGRAGRDGLPSICKILYAQSDLTIQQEFIRWQNPTPDLIMQTMSAIEARFAHDDFDSDDLRIHVIGKGHAHGLGGGVMEYVLIRLAELGAIELAAIPGDERGPGGSASRYRYVRTIDDDEIDADTINEKLKRDLMRLLDVVKMTKADDIPGYISDYFDL